MKRSAWTRSIVAVAASTFGLVTATAFAVDPPSTAGPSDFPHYQQLILQDAALLQDTSQEEGEEQEEKPEERVQVSAKDFTALSEDILTASELGLTRPGEISTVSRYAFKLGEVRLFPRYHQEVRFDDNIFLTDSTPERRQAGVPNPSKDSRKWDIRFEERPGLFMELPFGAGKHSFHAGYEANIVNFMRRHQGFGFVEQYAGASLNFDWNTIKLSGGDRYELRYDPIETQFAGVSSGGQPTNQLKRGINSAYYKIGADADKLIFKHLFNYEYIDFAGPGFITRADRDELTMTFLAGIKARENLDFFAQWDYLTRRQRENFIGDSFYNRYSLGVSGEISEDFKTESRIGWRHQLNETGRPIGDDDSRDGGIDISSDTNWRMNEQTIWTLRYVRESAFSIQANFQIVDHAEIGVENVLWKDVLGKVGYFIEHVDPSQGDTFTSAGVGFGMRYRLSDNLDFDTDYTFRYRISNAPASDYYNHLVSAALNYKF